MSPCLCLTYLVTSLHVAKTCRVFSHQCILKHLRCCQGQPRKNAIAGSRDVGRAPESPASPPAKLYGYTPHISSLLSPHTHAKAALERCTGAQVPAPPVPGLLPAYVVLRCLSDEPHALQHVGNVVDPSLLYVQRLSRFV